MSWLGFYVLAILVAPVIWGLGLIAAGQIGQRQERRGRPTVAEIVARVQAERAQRDMQWPVHDLDRGVIRDERPTQIIPRSPDDER